MKIRIPTLLIACGGMALSPLTAQDAPKPDVTIKPALPLAKETTPEKPKAERPEGERKLDRKESPRSDKGKPGHPDEHHAKSAPEKPTTYLGLLLEGVPPPVAAQVGIPEGFGLLVVDVAPDSPAKTADLQKFDVVTLIGDQRVVNLPQFQSLIRSQKKGESVTLTISRKGQEQKVTAVLGERMLPAGRPEGMHPPMPFGHGRGPMHFQHMKRHGMKHGEHGKAPQGHGSRDGRGHHPKMGDMRDRHHGPDVKKGPEGGPCPNCDGPKDSHGKPDMKGHESHDKRGPGPDEHAKRGPGPDGDHRQMDRQGPPPARRDGPEAKGPDGPSRGGPGPDARRGDGLRPAPEGAPRGPEPRRDGDRGPAPQGSRDGDRRPADGPPPAPSKERA